MREVRIGDDVSTPVAVKAGMIILTVSRADDWVLARAPLKSGSSIVQCLSTGSDS